MKPPPFPAVGRRTQADAAVESFIRAHRDGQVPDELLAPTYRGRWSTDSQRQTVRIGQEHPPGPGRDGSPTLAPVTPVVVTAIDRLGRALALICSTGAVR
jgi:hypothetical protein